MNAGDVKKIVLALVLLGAAGVLFVVMKPSGADVPDDETTLTYWWDTETNQEFTIPGSEREAKVRQRRIETEQSPATGPRTRRSGTDLESVAMSPYTQKYTGVQARLCPNDGTVFPMKNKRGERMICPQCKWDPTTGDTAQSDRETVLEDWK